MTRIARNLILLILISGTPIIHCAQDPNPGNYNNNSPSSPKRHDAHFEAPEPDPLLEKNNYAELLDKNIKHFQVADTMINFNGKLKAQVGTPEKVSEFSPLPPTANLVDLGSGNDNNSKEVTTNLLRDSPSQSVQTGSDYSNGPPPPPADPEFDLGDDSDNKTQFENDTNDEFHTSFKDVLKKTHYAKSLTPPEGPGNEATEGDTDHYGPGNDATEVDTDYDPPHYGAQESFSVNVNNYENDDNPDPGMAPDYDEEGRVRDFGEEMDMKNDYTSTENNQWSIFDLETANSQMKLNQNNRVAIFKHFPKSMTCFDRHRKAVDCKAGAGKWKYAFYPLTRYFEKKQDNENLPHRLHNDMVHSVLKVKGKYRITLIINSRVIKQGQVFLNTNMERFAWPLMLEPDVYCNSFTVDLPDSDAQFFLFLSDGIFEDYILKGKCIVRLISIDGGMN